MNKHEINLEQLYPIIEEVIASGGEFRLYPKGTSMLPIIRQGIDSIVLCAIGDVCVNDILLYKRDDGSFVLHRVVKIKNDEYIMCGDNQFDLERGITQRHLLAKVKYFYRENEKITGDNIEYQKYLKTLPRVRRRRKIRNTLGRIKNKIIKPKKQS